MIAEEGRGGEQFRRASRRARATKYPMRVSLRGCTAGTSRYSDATVYNKFQRQTRMRVIFRRAYIVRHAPANIATIPHPGHVPMKLRNLQTDEMQRRIRRATEHVFQHPRAPTPTRTKVLLPTPRPLPSQSYAGNQSDLD